jgi:hypothetical protein
MSGSPRRCHWGSTWFEGASENLPVAASSELSESRTTTSFSVACILHVEYTIFWTPGTIWDDVTPKRGGIQDGPTYIAWHVLPS